jgi:hypothetical protein
LAVGFANTPIATAWAWGIRPELWVEPPPISFCQILFDRIGWAGGAGSPR